MVGVQPRRSIGASARNQKRRMYPAFIQGYLSEQVLSVCTACVDNFIRNFTVPNQFFTVFLAFYPCLA